MITQLLSYNLAYAFAWTLAHSIWQLTIIAVVLGLLLRVTRAYSPQSRYLISFGALAVGIVSSVVTFAIYYGSAASSTAPAVANFTGEFLGSVSVSGDSNFFGLIDTYLHDIVNFWLLGSVLFLVKIIGGYTYIKCLTNQASLEEDHLMKKLNKLKSKFKIHRDVVIRSSSKVLTPMVVGYLRPVILFPIGLANQLTGDEVAAILAHELAHVKRHDFLFNLIQSLTEALFYFHPAIWYISSSITRERENCCDDMAIHYTSNRISYAKTLIKLQEMKAVGMTPALSIAGGKGSFVKRIKRILEVPVQGNLLKEKVIAAVLICSTLVGFASEAGLEEHYIDTDELDVYIIDDCPQDINEIKYYLDTIPERNNFHVKRSSKNMNLELKMEDGIIQELIIDGRIIPESEYLALTDIIQDLTPGGRSEIITVFPDCGEDFGNIYYLNKNKVAVNLDSILGDVTARMKEFEDFKHDKFDFHIDKFDNKFIDSLREEVKSLDLLALAAPNKIKIDSILDLINLNLGELNFNALGLDHEEWNANVIASEVD